MSFKECLSKSLSWTVLPKVPCQESLSRLSFQVVLLGGSLKECLAKRVRSLYLSSRGLEGVSLKEYLAKSACQGISVRECFSRSVLPKVSLQPVFPRVSLKECVAKNIFPRASSKDCLAKCNRSSKDALAILVVQT